MAHHHRRLLSYAGLSLCSGGGLVDRGSVCVVCGGWMTIKIYLYYICKVNLYSIVIVFTQFSYFITFFLNRFIDNFVFTHIHWP